MREEVIVAIVGAGPAGSAAAMFLKRAGLEPVLLEEGPIGGLLRDANLVENYPGFPDGIRGADLADSIGRQLARLDVRIERRPAVVIEADSDGGFVILADGAEYRSRVLVMASGTSPRKLRDEWAEELEDRKLFYGISKLDLETVRDRRVVVLGGGDAAFDYALNLKSHGASPSIVMRSAPTCLPLLLERAAARGIEVHVDSMLERVDETPHGLEVVCSGKKPFKCDLVVVAHGREARLEALSPELIQSVRGSFGRYPETTTEGLYVVGDVVRGKCRQTAIAAGDGVLAAMKIIEFLRARGVCA